jgi:L,D-transpeptidase YcbB
MVTYRCRKAIRIHLIQFATLIFALSAASCGKHDHRSVGTDVMAASDQLRARLTGGESVFDVCAGGERLIAVSSVSEFYERRNFAPVWSLNGDLLPDADALKSALEESRLEGLRPEDYHLSAIGVLAKKLRGKAFKDQGGYTDAVCDADLLLTDSFLVYATHLAAGKVDQDSPDLPWIEASRWRPAVDLLNDALASSRIKESLQALAPPHEYYAGLKKAFASFLKLAAKSAAVVPLQGAPLKKGDRGPGVRRLRGRLAGAGFGRYLGGRRSRVFDEALERTVCRFQEMNGLVQTGIADEATLKILNATPGERLAQIATNLERWRWLSHVLGERYAIVDVAAFEMRVMDHGREAMRMNIVGGMPGWPTPAFSSRINEIVINPYWIAPSQVLLKELINYVKADPNYLPGNKMRLMRGWGENQVEVDVATLDLNAVTVKNLDFYLRQDCGPWNMLGQVKFSMPNAYDVYLHDTPYQADFGRSSRTFSHGCIRIARPVAFALFLLDNPAKWTETAILERQINLVEQKIRVRNPFNVHVIYATAWPSEDGRVRFRPDVYDQDQKIIRALRRGLAETK